MSIIQSLKAEGVLKLYSDFRSGTYDDFSGNSHDATPTGAILKKEHKGYALEMVNGTVGTQFVSIPQHADFNFGASTDFSVYVWFKPRMDISGTTNRVLSNSSISPLGGWSVDFTTAKHRLFFRSAGVGEYILTADNAVSNITEDTHACFTIDRDGSGTIYQDGLLVASTQTNPAAINTDVDTVSNLQIGRVLAQTNLNFDGVFYVALVVNRLLTATEISQIYADLNDTKYPLKTFGATNNRQLPDLDDADLVGAWDMKPVAGVIQDLSSNNNTGTIYGNPMSERTLLGNALRLNGVDASVEASDASLNFQGKKSLTLSAWVKTNDTTGTHYVLVNGINQYAYNLSIASNGAARIVIDGDFTGDMDLYGTSTTLRDKQWHHLATTLGTDGATSTLSIYVDGVLENSSTFSDYTMTVSNNGMYIGRAQGTYANSTIANPEIYDGAKSAAWVLSKYKSGASAVQYKTDWGANVSSADVSSGELGGTGFTVDSGTWQVDTDTIDGVKVKTFACTTDNGIIYIPIDRFNLTQTEGMYGTWEWYWYQQDASNLIHVMMNDEVGTPGAGSANGYIFRYGVAERFRLRVETAGSVGDVMSTNASYFTTGQWYKMKVTRNTSGVWTVYRDGVLVDLTGGAGTNPSTNNTHTTAKYFSIQARATDLIAIADVGGGHSFTKHLGVI